MHLSVNQHQNYTKEQYQLFKLYKIQHMPNTTSTNQIKKQFKSYDIKFQFRFPQSFEVNMEFSDQAHLQRAIQIEQENSSNLLVKNLWQRRQRDLYLYYICRYCSSRMSFVKIDDRIRINKLTIDHNHDTSMKKQLLRIQLNKKNEVDTTGIRQMINLKNESDVFDLANLKNQLMRQSNPNNFINLKGYTNLLKFVNQHKYLYAEEWENQIHQTGRFPQFMVFISPLMSSNYTKYGDVVFFQIYKNFTSTISKNSKCYEIGVFYGEDSNRRPILLGVVLFTQLKNYQKIFVKYFELLEKKHPQSIVVNQQQEIIVKTLKNLIELNKINSVCVYNVWVRLKKICYGLNLKAPPNLGDDQLKCVKVYAILLKKLMSQKDKSKAQKILYQLGCQMENSQMYYDIINDFFNNIKTTCFWQIPQAFIGLSRYTNRKKNQEFQKAFKSKFSISQPTIDKFLPVLDIIDNELNEKSICEFRMCNQSIEKCYHDERLMKLRKQCQNWPYRIFFQNYIEARQMYQEFQSQNSAIINIETQQIIQIDELNCRCNYYIKTGIPCSHTIFRAITKSEIEYKDLFNKRWIKESNRKLRIKQNRFAKERLLSGKREIKKKNIQ